MKNHLRKFNALQKCMTKGGSYLLVLLLLACSHNLQAQANLQITELFPGQSGEDLTSDWFEITNTGDQAWVAGVDPDLYYDDESASAADADLIIGLTDIQPGEYIIVLITGDVNDIEVFKSVWGP
ncbi:MAG: hypothetical protein KTR30_32370, partial [Saprospiraceae bacterium]|nr:hypothetical protein [Saprospiraceae bacterium]